MLRTMRLQMNMFFLLLMLIVFTHAFQSKPVTDSFTYKNQVNWAQILSVADIRMEPNATNPVIVKVNKGDTFPIIKEEGGWVQVQLGSDQPGWVQAGSISSIQVSDPVQVVKAKGDSQLYWGPDDALETGSRLLAGTTLIPIKVSGMWIEVSSQWDRSWWLPIQQVSWGSGTMPVKAVLAQAKPAESKKRPQPLENKTIVIDAGHGGRDPGAIGTIQPVYEREVNLSVAQVLKDKLQAAGAHVIMTRTSNDQFVSLEDRAKISNASLADAFISIHQNMLPSDPSVSGTITFFESDESRDLAKNIESAATSQLHSREEKTRIEKEQLYVLSHNLRPAVLIEGCFLSNPDELKRSVEPIYQENLATGIYEGILKTLKR